ncbi:hypothetical protein [Seleniivibrio sp.]|uniref:hypothetical protein n=1 Tax=Seleniivibrio sp. TaxID=2898801 RepID=UPI0025E1967A|nr:hypothetical protein [Seleniivibrio sp.]MCD8553644.1 hypothetical protein [Seleniivibrio sp.]
MRKLLVALMMVAFAATAFAADIKFSGSYEVNGRYTDNYNLNGLSEHVYTGYGTGTPTQEYQNGAPVASDDAVSASWYKQTFDLWMNVQTDKDTFFKSMIEFVDDKYANGSPNSQDGDYAKNGLGGDNFELQRAWLGHNFGGILLEAGLMNSGTWGYAFGDNAEGNMRIKATFDVPYGKLSVYTQKSAESSDINKKDSEDDDADKYSIGYKGTFGGIMVAPKLDYDIKSSGTKNGDYEGSGDSKTIDFDLAAGGKFGALTVEAEYQLKSTSLADEGTGNNKDYDVYGFYLNANYNLGSATVGALTAYASVSSDDETQGYSFGDDFDVTFILDDELALGDKNGIGMTGFWTTALYATYDVNDKLNVMAKYAYAKSNWKSDSGANKYLEDATAWELDGMATYAITKDLSYYVLAGYAKVDLDVDGVDDPDGIILVKNGLAINF